MTYTVHDLQERYGVGEHTILAWIRSGELRAINVGVSPGKKKPRWRISAESLAQFEAARTLATPSTPARRKRVTAAVCDIPDRY
jgi:transposase